MSNTWHWLDGFDEPILIRHEFGVSDYAIWVTDLENLWVERLNRRELIKRALGDDISIDPSEDADQMQKFLSYLKRALNQEPATDLRFSSNDRGSTLTLHLRAELAASLPDLTWECHLAKCAPPDVTKTLLVPLFASQVSAKVERDYLLARIRENDAVISKLVNHMQADGFDFSKTFPGALLSKSYVKSDVRHVLSKSIKGMGEFEHSDWQGQAALEAAQLLSVQDLRRYLDPVTLKDLATSSNGSSDTAWWNQPRRTLPIREPGNQQHLTQDTIPHVHTDEVHQSADGDFQRQRTPTKAPEPKAMHESTPTATKTPLLGDESTTDDSDDDPTGPPKPAANDISAAKSLPSASPQVKSPPSRSQLTGKGSSPVRDQAINISPVSDAFGLSESIANKPKAKLGRIGGKKMTDEGRGHEPAPPVTAPTKSNGVNVQVDSDPVRGRPVDRTREISPVRETSIERANRNRES